MRMSDNADSETMKVSEAANSVSPAMDNATKAEVCPQSQSSRDKPSNKKDSQSRARLKLVRSLAVCEESFPCPSESPAALQDGLPPPETEERGTKDQAEKEAGDKPDTPRKTLSRDSSQDYTDSTGIDLHEFLVNTLKGNPRDRIMLLKLEQDILDFISNNECQKRKFPPMTSYHRMLLHRVAAYFGMEHNVDPSGKSVIINKTANTRIPDQKFSEHIKDERVDDFQKRYILKRDNASFDRDDSSIRMRLKADRRSKSMEEREEEYQRARQRIFAHDGDHFILDPSAPEEHSYLSTQQRRQMFRLRAVHSGASRQSSSETEAAPRHGEPRPWSSTDSSDSSNRLALRPAITKASSFSGISPSLVRGDSSASSKSTSRLSKTGSESCSSVGSSSSSLSHPHLPLPVPPPLRCTAVINRGHLDTAKNAPTQLPASTPDATSFCMLPLESSGIPPGSVLVHQSTGKPLLQSDCSALVYNSGRAPQRGKTPPHPLPAPPQQQLPNHIHVQPLCPSLQPSSIPVPSAAVSYPPQFLPVCPNQHYTVPEVLSAPFGHLSLSQQPSNDSGTPAPDGSHYPPPYQHPSPVLLQGAQQVSGYMVGGHPGMHPNPSYPNTGPPLSQLLLQQHAYIQQPLQQMTACFCSSAHQPHCSNQQGQQVHRAAPSQLTYNCPQSHNLPQQQVHQAVMSNPASSYQTVVGLQPTASLGPHGNQQSNMAPQMQGMMVQYPAVQPYQPSVPQQTYQQPVFVSCQQGAMTLPGVQPYYSLMPPNQHTTMSSTVSFLPGPMMEPLQFPQSSSPCISQQHPGQQYGGLLPPAPPGGMLMLQMSGPPCQQPRAASPCQRKPPSHKHSAPEQQRGRRPAELPITSDAAQNSLSSSPALTPSPGQPPSIKGLRPTVTALPVLTHHPQLPAAFHHIGQGEASYSLLGQPLQYKPSIRPPLIHSAHLLTKQQGPLGVWRSGHGRKSSRKPVNPDLS